LKKLKPGERKKSSIELGYNKRSRLKRKEKKQSRENTKEKELTKLELPIVCINFQISMIRFRNIIRRA
jgi:hypothetical protein